MSTIQETKFAPEFRANHITIMQRQMWGIIQFLSCPVCRHGRLPATLLAVAFLCQAGAAQSTFTVTNTADSGPGSLHWAITNANANSGTTNIINFQISGDAPYSIALLNALPPVINPWTIIDATTQTNYSGTPVVELNGTSVVGSAVGLQLNSPFNTVRGLAINRFTSYGVFLSGASNVIQGNFIGTDTTGSIAQRNVSFGIYVQSSGNQIGGITVNRKGGGTQPFALGNLISGGNDTGIYIYGAGGNVVQGNYIGLGANGASALGNNNNGIMINGGDGNLVGGPGNARNFISGNGGSGIFLNGGGASQNVISNNFIGTDNFGELALSNVNDGIIVNGAPSNTISGNVISGNGTNGVYLAGAGAAGNVLAGNFIGTDVAGTLLLGNHSSGVAISAGSGNLIGAGNVISGNLANGLFLTGGASGNLVQGNIIGLSAAGTNALPNGFNGISISGASSNIVGGAVSAARNLISGNTNNGIGIYAVTDVQNMIVGNYIGTDITGTRAVPNTLVGVYVQGCSNVIGGATAGSGNVISRNGQEGVELVGTSGDVVGNVVQGNWIGLDATGTNSLGNGNAGVAISSAAANQIGGAAPGARNVISGNGNNGMILFGAGTSGNVVQGNYLGTDQTGSLARGNRQDGILLQSVNGNQIGGSISGAGNLISGNTADANGSGNNGIYLNGGSWNTVQGNRIGTDASGTLTLGNSWNAIFMQNANSNQIGGVVAGAGNLLSANGREGIYLVDSSRNVIQGNRIGTDASGTLGLGNDVAAIYMVNANSNQIGGVVAGAGNLLSGNGQPGLLGEGIYFGGSTWNVIQGNFIGTKADGTNALGNLYHNIELDAGSTNNTIGGTAAGAGNRIAFAKNAQYSGVRVRTGSLNNLISGNSIFSNAELGIDLGAFGVNPIVHLETNVAVNAANAGQNYPVLSNIYVGTATQIRGTFDSATNRTYVLQFFSSPTGNNLGYGEGRIFLGQASLSLGAICPSNFTVTLPVSVPAGWVVTATATDPANNTSEFSAWIPVVIVPQVQSGAVNPISRQISLSWTNNGGSYVLQQTFSLNSPQQWTVVTNSPALSNGYFVLPLPATNANAFYRLQAQ
jgi:parallel beta-helix repeat protein